MSGAGSVSRWTVGAAMLASVATVASVAGCSSDSGGPSLPTVGDASEADGDNVGADIGLDGGDDGAAPDAATDVAETADVPDATDGGDGSSVECVSGEDCQSGICREGSCVEGACDDLVKNGDETDTDCGGEDCKPCGADKACLQNSDCRSENCESGQCSAATCDDGIKNGNESGVDCGSIDCGDCETGKECDNDTDCESGVCDQDQCVAPSCTDGEKNGSETATDCGGDDCAPCTVGDACNKGDDCQTKRCQGGSCAAATCRDGIQNGQETGTDCGGNSCDPCPDGEGCGGDGDCVSGVCDGGTCQAPACDDSVENGKETGPDCGGPDCPACPPNEDCKGDSDCTSEICEGGTCQAPACDDKVANGSESDVDCGGSKCPACPPNDACNRDGDCTTGVCDTGTCQPAECGDGVKNGKETGVDCGGEDCGKCSAGKGCDGSGDCKSGVCAANTCQAPTCNDSVENGGETDKDCGGRLCPDCGIGDDCRRHADCATQICQKGECKKTTRIVGALTEMSPGSWGDGTYAESCAAYRNPTGRRYVYEGSTGDGWYEIKPFSTKPAFEVYCDMTTDGGGWTGVSPEVAKEKFKSNLTSLIGREKWCSFNGVRPEQRGAQAGRKYICRYDMGLGFTFDQVRVSNVKVVPVVPKPPTQGTLDVHFLDAAWGTVECSSCKGDFRFGSASYTGSQILSFGETVGGFPACRGAGNFGLEGDEFIWDGNQTSGASDTTLRLEFTESCGGEGWRWEAGRVFVRDRSRLVSGIRGKRTQKEPGYWADGTFAPSCQAYRFPGGRWYAYQGSTGSGWYTIKPHANKNPFPVYCDMQTDGGGWTGVDPEGVGQRFGHSLTELSGSRCVLRNGTQPAADDSSNNDPQCRYEVDLGFDISEIRLSQVEIEAMTQRTSDLSGVDRPWGNPVCSSYSGADWWWGTPAANKRAISAGAEFSRASACSKQSKVQFGDGDAFTLDGKSASTARDSTLRMEFGETGSQKEGWVWRSGRVFVRDGKGTP